MIKIPFNKPHLVGKELYYIAQSVLEGHISGNGEFTQKCHTFFESHFGYKKTLLTNSCTDALEMCAILLDIKPGDEVIIPSYTFVSTALAFIRQGATIIFADSRKDHPGIDEDAIESLITSKTKAIVPVHYAGIACDMDKILALGKKYDVMIVEDAAQAIGSTYKGKLLGGIGDLGVFSFHETKNIQCGEGGLLIVNNEKFLKRAEIIWEKGTNRAEFFRGEVNKYGWVDIGSSFLPSDLTAAFLLAQLEEIDTLQTRRLAIWKTYALLLEQFEEQGIIRLPHTPEYSTNNAHIFYLLFSDHDKQQWFISEMKERGCTTVFHYQSLHTSDYYKEKHDERELPNCDYYADCLVRLPLYFDLEGDDLTHVLTQLETVLSMMK